MPKAGGWLSRGGVSGAHGEPVSGRLHVLGVNEAIRKLKLVGSVAGRDLGYAVYNRTMQIVRKAKDYCPVVTGNLQSSIQAEKLGKYWWEVSAASMNGTDPAGIGKNQKEYAYYVHYGSKHNSPPKPFLEQAYNEERGELQSDLWAIGRHLEML